MGNMQINIHIQKDVLLIESLYSYKLLLAFSVKFCSVRPQLLIQSVEASDIMCDK